MQPNVLRIGKRLTHLVLVFERLGVRIGEDRLAIVGRWRRREQEAALEDGTGQRPLVGRPLQVVRLVEDRARDGLPFAHRVDQLPETLVRGRDDPIAALDELDGLGFVGRRLVDAVRIFERAEDHVASAALFEVVGAELPHEAQIWHDNKLYSVVEMTKQ